jgi:hypothetical protein
MADAHLCVVRWCLHTIPEDFQELLLGLLVTPGDSIFYKYIYHNAETLASVAGYFL